MDSLDRLRKFKLKKKKRKRFVVIFFVLLIIIIFSTTGFLMFKKFNNKPLLNPIVSIEKKIDFELPLEDTGLLRKSDELTSKYKIPVDIKNEEGKGLLYVYNNSDSILNPVVKSISNGNESSLYIDKDGLNPKETLLINFNINRLNSDVLLIYDNQDIDGAKYFVNVK